MHSKPSLRAGEYLYAISLRSGWLRLMRATIPAPTRGAQAWIVCPCPDICAIIGESRRGGPVLGLVKVVPDPNNAPRQKVFLTKKGRDLLLLSRGNEEGTPAV
jgi:hypothetical protein